MPLVHTMLTVLAFLPMLQIFEADDRFRLLHSYYIISVHQWQVFFFYLKKEDLNVLSQKQTLPVVQITQTKVHFLSSSNKLP